MSSRVAWAAETSARSTPDRAVDLSRNTPWATAKPDARIEDWAPLSLRANFLRSDKKNVSTT